MSFPEILKMLIVLSFEGFIIVFMTILSQAGFGEMVIKSFVVALNKEPGRSSLNNSMLSINQPSLFELMLSLIKLKRNIIVSIGSAVRTYDHCKLCFYPVI